VQYANQLYYFTGLWPNTGHVALDEADILDNLRAIASHETERQAGIGVLTSQTRSKWAVRLIYAVVAGCSFSAGGCLVEATDDRIFLAFGCNLQEAREELCKTEANATALRIIDSALFVLVLDDFVPADINEAAANVLHGTNRLKDDDGTGDDAQIGTCLNRWYDKLQLIVCRDGTSGLIFEHSIIDGHTALRFASDVYAETLIAFAESIVDLIHGPGRVTHVLEAVVERSTRRGSGEMVDVRPRKLVFELSDSLLDAIYYAETALCDEISANDTQVLEFREFGKRLVVGNKISPDAFVQMMILLAYYRLYGKADCMYEPALTKQFFHGRTEAIRGTTPQAVQFCQTFLCKTASRDEKLEALRVATTEHSRLTAESSQGLGVDRHLFALKCIAKRMGMPTPALFESAAWKALGHTVLSTSNCGNPSLRLFGFGPVVPDGFGIGYIIKDHGFSFSVCSKHRQTKRYVDKLRLSLMDLQELLEPISNVSVHHHHPSVGNQNNNQSSTSRPRDDDQLEQNGYGDIYGENHLPAAPAIPAAIGMGRRTVSSGGQYFSRIQERSESVSLLAVTDLGVEVLDSSKKLEI
jgi:carnitine O-acetyltransferase